ICENILHPDAARFCSNTRCIARKRNKIRVQNFHKVPQAQWCGIALIIIHRGRMRKAGFCACSAQAAVI
ncbi:MAG TPA: hypothetical protein H9745_00395, partial [Candidatus Agathobaculum stercoravium]|nr:hypothetical protein [Candidatus Agathobaculum stercoravium]